MPIEYVGGLFLEQLPLNHIPDDEAICLHCLYYGCNLLDTEAGVRLDHPQREGQTELLGVE